MPSEKPVDRRRTSSSRDDGILIEILGESRPFSKYGQSICYSVNVLGHQYLVDCGAPIFEHLPRKEIEEIDGLLATHSHEDHKRWFTDLAIYMNYLTDGEKRLNLFTIDPIHEEFMKNSRGALERTLSPDSRDVIEVPYESFVNPISFGPSAKYRIVSDRQNGGIYGWHVVDEEGNEVPPDRAKVVIKDQEQANRPRMLFRDPETSNWVEPAQFYSFGSEVFYKQDWNPIEHRSEDGSRHVSVSPVKDPVWHGPPTIGIEIQTGEERVVFSSDTVYDPDLWKHLAHDQREMKFQDITREEFDSSTVVYGDINNFIEQSWSEHRLENALNFYRDAVVIHDCGPEGDPVHTGYSSVRDLDCDGLILTHCPDRFISEFPIAIAGKKFRILENEILEEVDANLYPMKGDVYLRDSNAAYVGFEQEDGAFQVIDKGNVLDLVPVEENVDGAERLMTVDLYRDINGKYYPYLGEPNELYEIRPDERVEKVQYNDDSSQGVLVENLRTENGGVPENEHP